ncbi:TetR/AcrR family transcriptional regulator C-terminal domain-containing protein [Gordonia sp. HY002]|uniref:TetR/AcrR family transcriptional regulator n=1 Tax=Gordonia zhenghanii TaxID=2911516 RepID=UPI001EF0DBB7|nr:TetR/AcrR family transcriptional regulator C-terminal domain-containing protein [Gordonia zhenghanii]MCF8571280.1 TetR/AcrR family transcriptional regulator C-terminal domain-containing protein [Gordonia zhenghanii]MCF8601804.1 TetR/AcrR family transcriptional regulator C-terminal domain-containing protein [Gordonia zhenghanii]
MTQRTAHGSTPRRGRRRASHSMETVIGETVALLDEAGEAALTFRALAARLGGGVASIYWYVDNRDELLDRATDHVLGGVVEQTDEFADTDDPISDLRAVAVALFDAVVERPWLGRYLMRDNGTQPNGMRMYEALGQQVMRLGLGPREAFHGVSAVLGFVIGTATDLGQQVPAEVRDGTVSGEELIARAADQWRSLDPDEYPFVHYIVDEFATHDDADQFRAGLDLVLAGLRLQAGM